MTNRGLRGIAVAGLCLVASAASAQTSTPAQKAPVAETPLAANFDQLPRFVKPGDHLIVVGIDGRSIQGQVRSLSATSLALKKRGTTIEFARNDVATIRHKPDSPLNGTLIGLGAGFGLGLLVGVSIDDESTTTTDVLCLVGIPAAGAAAGFALDWAHTDRPLIFQKARLGVTAGVGLVQPPNRIAKPRASIGIVIPLGRK